jgi:predicted CDP-diglyceride synthetase/phosphatidate cytidylyltransferase
MIVKLAVFATCGLWAGILGLSILDVSLANLGLSRAILGMSLVVWGLSCAIFGLAHAAVLDVLASVGHLRRAFSYLADV